MGEVLPRPFRASGRRLLPRRASLLILLGLGLWAGIAVYALDNPFRDDDFAFLDHALSSRSLVELLSPPPNRFACFRPGAYLLFAAELRFIGLDASGFLLVNLLLHLLNAFLMFRILSALGFPSSTTWLATFLFVVGFGHYSKEVFWACTSGPLMAITLSLLALLFTVRLARPSRCGSSRSSDAESNESRSVQPWHVAIIVWSVGIASLMHEAALATPLLLAITLRLLSSPQGRLHGRHAALFMFPAAAWLCILALSSAQFTVYRESVSRVLQVPRYLLRYPGFMLLPIQDSQWVLAFPIQLLLSGAFLVAILMIWRSGRKEHKILSAWFYVALLPHCLVPLSGRWLEMRYLYASAIPLCALFATAISQACRFRRTWTPRVAATTTIALVVLASLCFQFVMERTTDRYCRGPKNTARFEDLTTKQP